MSKNQEKTVKNVETPTKFQKTENKPSKIPKNLEKTVKNIEKPIKLRKTGKKP